MSIGNILRMKPLNARDTTAFLMHAGLFRKTIGNDALLVKAWDIPSRFCERVGISRHDFIVTARHKDWPQILLTLQRTKKIST
jgi:hypothetical protein